MQFFPEVEISEHQAEAIARGMVAVARAEGGVHEQEMALIKSFWADAGGASSHQLSALMNAPDIEPNVLATAISGALAPLFLKTALLLAYADGNYAPEERTLIERYATALGVARDELGRLEHGVKEYLLGHLAHLANVESAAQVGRKLKI
jgi:tellurite resistance protein